MNDAQQKLDQVILKWDEKPSSVALEELAALISAGANPSSMTIPIYKGAGGKTSALIISAAMGLEGVVELFLLDEGLDVRALDSDGEHAFFSALYAGRPTTAKLLFERSDVCGFGGWGTSCLSAAIGSDLAALAEQIIERMNDQKRQETLADMREDILTRDDLMGQEALESHIMALLQSKIEQAAMEDSLKAKGVGPRKPRSL